MAYIGWAHYAANLLHGVEIWAQSTMHREDLLVDDSCDGQAIEAICESLPQFDVISSFAFVVEAIDSVDGGTFVVSTKDEEVFWILDLVGKKQAYRFERLFASVDIVSQKEVICLRGKPTVFEQSQEIVILSMNVAADLQCAVSTNFLDGEVLHRTLALIGASSSSSIG